jgi:hypothetical protein
MRVWERRHCGAIAYEAEVETGTVNVCVRGMAFGTRSRARARARERAVGTIITVNPRGRRGVVRDRGK